MPLTKIEKNEVMHIKYNREQITDQEALKNELAREAFTTKSRDTILELTDATMIYSAEIGIIVQFVKTLTDTERQLHLVASNYVCEMLTTMNMHRIPKITLYNSLEEVQKKFPGVELKEG